MNLYDMSITDYLTKLSSTSPTPGVGSAAALTGAIGTSLASMVANSTITKKQYARYESELQAILAEFTQIKNELLNHIQKDAQATEAIIAAMSLPNATSSESNARQEAIQASLKQSIMIPLEIMNLCESALKLCKKSMDKCNEAAISELASASVNLNSAIKTAFLDILVIVVSIKDNEFVFTFRKNSGALVSRAEALHKEIHSYCLSEMIKAGS